MRLDAHRSVRGILVTNRKASDQLIVALDVPTVLEAAGIVENLGDAVSFYKIGYQLAFSGGMQLADELVRAGKRVFLDLKLLDIDNTVAIRVNRFNQASR